jgi:uncharacterized protein
MPLAGARDIIAETINEDPQARSRVRDLFFDKAVIRSQVVAGKEAKGPSTRIISNGPNPSPPAPSHRILAMRRGEKEDVLSLSITPQSDTGHRHFGRPVRHRHGTDADQVRTAAHDAYKRLLSRSMETEVRVALKERADAEAIRVFADNLRQLLLASPLGAKRVMGIDPGFRTGCKVVCLDRQGKLLHSDTVYPHGSDRQAAAAVQTIEELCRRFNVEAVAVGNGTAGRETQTFVNRASMRKPCPSSWSTRAAHRSTRRRKSPVRNSPTTISPYAAPSPSAAG